MRVLIIAVLVSLTPLQGAEDPKHTQLQLPASGVDAATRRTAPVTIREEILEPLSTLFSQPKRYIVAKYGELLPKALEAMKNGDEKPIAEMIGELNGRIDGKDVPAVLEDAEARLKTMSNADPLDREAIGLVERIAQSLKLRKGEPDTKTDQAVAFNKAFEPAYKKELEKVQTILKDVKTAIDPKLTPKERQVAKERLQKEVNWDAALAWVDSRMRAGDTQGAADFMEAYSTDGHVDLWKEGKPFRLELGETREELVSSLKTLSTENPGMFSMSLASKSHDGKEYTQLKNEGGKLVSSQVVTAAAVSPNAVASNRAQASGQGGQASSGRADAKTAQNAGAVGNGRALFQQFCLSCHATNGIEILRDKGISWVEGGRMPPASSKSLHDAVHSENNGAVRTAILKYLREGGALK